EGPRCRALVRPHQQHPARTSPRQSIARRTSTAASKPACSSVSKSSNISYCDTASRIGSRALRTNRTLLRRELARCGRRAGEIGGEFFVPCLHVACRLLLHRAIAANALRQREQLDRRIKIGRRQLAQHGRDVLLVGCDQAALEPAIPAVAKNVE